MQESGDGMYGGAPGRCGDFTLFSKKYAFLGIFWPKSLLKDSFIKSLNEMC